MFSWICEKHCAIDHIVLDFFFHPAPCFVRQTHAVPCHHRHYNTVFLRGMLPSLYRIPQEQLTVVQHSMGFLCAACNYSPQSDPTKSVLAFQIRGNPSHLFKTTQVSK